MVQTFMRHTSTRGYDRVRVPQTDDNRLGLRSLDRATLAISLAATLTSTGCVPAAPNAAVSTSASEWAHYGGDAGGRKYSPLSDINRKNVARLELAWVVRTGDFPPEVFDASRHRAGGQREDGTPIQPRTGRACGSCHSTNVRFETTPLMRDGKLLVSTPRNRVLALHPGTGTIHWTFDPQVSIRRRYAEDLTSRGLAVWTDERAPPDGACARRVFLATVDARLFALDASTGVPCSDFGTDGAKQLDNDTALSLGVVGPDERSFTSPPTVVGDLVVVGSAISTAQRRDVATGIVRAYDARTGALRWFFDPLRAAAQRPAANLSRPEAASRTGGANVWSIISADPDRDLVFLPTGSAAPDFYGGARPGRNDFANSVIALRGSTGEFVWSFQIVHHDLWDYDVAAQPMLITLRLEGRERPAVVVGTKTGMVFVLDRETGVPLLPIEERRVPVSDVPGERAWLTQPFPVHTPLLHGTALVPDSAFGITDADRTFCREWIARLRNEGIFTPPSLQGTLLWPGLWGGINWSGMAWDPERQRLITTITRMPMVVTLHRRDEQVIASPDRPLGWDYFPQEGVPYAASRMPLVAPSGLPCAPPPWGSILAVDLADGSLPWSRPLGTIPALANVAGSEQWGSIIFGGPLVTAGGLVFIGAAQDDRFRAFDVDTGKLLWEYALPAGGQAAPMSYRYEGRQYVVIAAGGRAGIGSPGDWIVAFTLPEK
jgi:quinoprotein glucose dehydrogenase